MIDGSILIGVIGKKIPNILISILEEQCYNNFVLKLTERKMMKKLFMVFAMMLSSTVFAYTDSVGNNIREAGYESLTPSQKAEVLKNIADIAAVQQTPTARKTDESIETAKKWVGIGTAIGSGLASTAKELGMVANDFVKTPVGTMAAGILIWKFIGNDIMHVIGAILFWIIGFTVIWQLINRGKISSITYSKEKTTWFGKPRIENVVYNNVSDEFAWWLVPNGIVLGFGVAILFSA